VSEYVWTELRAVAIERFRNVPDATLEQRVIDVFREHPALVQEAIEHVARRFESGQVRSPWIVLAKHVSEAMRPLEEVTATDERERAKQIARAEAWIRVAGQHFDREEEILEELFGEFGRLKTWAEDGPLKVRMIALWGEVRPKGESIQAQAEERASARHKLLADLALDPEPSLDPDAEPALA